MSGRSALPLLKQRLWPRDAVRPARIYAVLDCARSPAIHDLIMRSYREKSCLFAGKLDPELERAAPFLLELQPSDGVTDQILLQGWTDAWGVLVQTDGNLRSLRRHLRTLLRVRTEDGRFLLFRYYDPRVLRVYLPTCTEDELALVFGESILRIFCCSEDEGMQIYSLVQGRLQTDQA